MPMTSSISWRTWSGSAAGRSILLMTGTISRSCSIAKIGVGQRLGLDALGGVHHQNGPFAGRQGTGDLVVEVHMARECRSG